MLRARPGLTAVAGVILFALAALAMARPVLADGSLPTALPDVVSGPGTQTLLALAEANDLTCDKSTPPSGASQWVCFDPKATDFHYSVVFTADPTLVMQIYMSGKLPWPEGHDGLVVDLAAPFCGSDQLEQIAALLAAAREAGPERVTFDNGACLLASDYMTDPIPVQLLTAFARVRPINLPTATPTALPTDLPTAPPPLATPTVSPAPTAGPSPTPPPTATPAGGGNEGGGGSDIEPGGFVRSVPTPAQVSSEPLIIAQSLALAVLLVLLMPFPAQLFNSTLETHYATVRRWFRLDALEAAAGRLGGLWDSILGVSLFVLLAAVLYSLLDPSVGLDARGAATIAGLAIGIVLTTAMIAAPTLLDALRSGGRWRLRALPATLIVGLVCVLISRLTGFLPGYLYGVILGFVFARQLSRAEQGRANGIGAALLLAMALISWLLLTAMGSNPTGIVATAAATTFSTLLVAGLEALVFGLLPFRFLPGEPLYATNRLFWAALLLIGAFCFFHIVINPASGYMSSTARTPLLTIVGLFVAFGLLSVVFWAYFRNKPVEG